MTWYADVFTPDGNLVERLPGVPECGVDFCDYCGDCLACYGGDDCPDLGCHRWVLHEDLNAERIAELRRSRSGDSQG